MLLQIGAVALELGKLGVVCFGLFLNGLLALVESPLQAVEANKVRLVLSKARVQFTALGRQLAISFQLTAGSDALPITSDRPWPLVVGYQAAS